MHKHKHKTKGRNEVTMDRMHGWMDGWTVCIDGDMQRRVKLCSAVPVPRAPSGLKVNESMAGGCERFKDKKRECAEIQIL
jgi:hypothetical protein